MKRLIVLLVFGWQEATLHCKALARPKSTEELAEIMRICHAYAQPVVPHGGLTGVAGGTKVSGDEIAITLERLNKIEEIDVTNKTVTVQAGLFCKIYNKKSQIKASVSLGFGGKR
jgi:FAD/FMN-containing dehydrogenase